MRKGVDQPGLAAKKDKMSALVLGFRDRILNNCTRQQNHGRQIDDAALNNSGKPIDVRSARVNRMV